VILNAMSARQRRAIAWAVWIATLLLTSSSPISQPQTPQPEGNQDAQRGYESSNDSKNQYGSSGPEAPFVYAIVAVILDGAANYCKNETGQKDNKWTHEFLCDVKITDAVIAVFTVLLTLVTGFLVWVGTYQAYQMRRTVRTMERTEVRQLRAYVFTRVKDATRDLTPVKTFGVQYSVYNNGQTPAVLLEIARSVDVFEYPLPSDFNLPPPIQIGGTAVIGPGDSFDAGFINADRLFLKDEITKIKAKTATLRIYYHGWLSYKDIFNETRTTEFCFSLIYNSSHVGKGGMRFATWDSTEGRNKFD